jgi:Tol biopolymer transport system component
LKAAVGLLALTTVAGFAVAYRGRSVAPAPMARFLVYPPEKGEYVSGGSVTNGASAAISPDGRMIAFTAKAAGGRVLLWVRQIESLTAHGLTGSEDATFPFWSPDSRFIAYFANGNLMKIAPTGGPPQTLCAANGRGGAWSHDGVLVFNGGIGGPLLRVSSAGGEPVPFTREPGTFPSFLPDGRRVLFYSTSASQGPGLYVTSLDTAPAKKLGEADSGGLYSSQSGRLLFVRQGTLLAQSFNPTTLAFLDDPYPVAEQVQAGSPEGQIAFSVSDNGVLAYGVGTSRETGLQMVWLDRHGKSIETVGAEENYRGLDLAPDGKRLAVHRHDGNGGDVWLLDLARGTTSRMTFSPQYENSSPIWSSDGTRIVFSSMRDGKGGLYVKSSTGAGTEQHLIESEGRIIPMSWSPDERSIVYQVQDQKTQADLWVLSLDGDRKATPLLNGSFNESHGQISPDGKWLAYNSNETGTSEIYVQTFLPGLGKWQVSTGGGVFPRWRRDGHELFYMDRTTNGEIGSGRDPVQHVWFGRRRIPGPVRHGLRQFESWWWSISPLRGIVGRATFLDSTPCFKRD